MRAGSDWVVLVALAAALSIPLGVRAQTAGVQPGSQMPQSGGAQYGANGEPQVAQPESGGVNWRGAGIGAATLVVNVGYIPAKMVYAILGGITGGAGYAITGGNQQTANSIWRSSLGGDYVVTPDMISGNAPIHFSGPSTAAAPANASNPALSSYAPPQPATGTAAYPSSPANTRTTSSANTGAPPYRAHTSGYGSSPLGRTHITSGPADSGAGPVRDRDIE